MYIPIPEILDESITVDDIGSSAVGSSELIDESITAADIGADQVGDSELFNGGDWITTSSLNIGTNGAALSISTDGHLLDEDDSLTINDDLHVTGIVVFDGDLEFTDLEPNGEVCGPNQVVVKVSDNDWRCSDYVEDQDEITISVVGFTTATYDGNMGGYDGANEKCDSEYLGSHICTVQEMLTTINYYDYKNDFTWEGTVWFSGGPPGFTANANDCKGFTSNNAGVLGRFWDLDQTATGGMAWLTSCAQQKRLACCK